MFKSLKYWQLSSALKAKGNSPGAFSAVMELGQLGDDRAVDLLIETLGRKDGVARSAARELGKLRKEHAIAPLVALLESSEVDQAAAEALLAFGAAAVGPVLVVLKSGSGNARQLATEALGELRDKRAVEPLIEVMQNDEIYAVRTAAAAALGNLKDARAVWVLVATLQMRDETEPDRQAALEKLRQATQLALRKIDPLAVKPGGRTFTESVESAVAEAERKLIDSGMHPRLLGDLKLLTTEEMMSVMKELVAASEEISWAKLESREPMLAAYFKTYEQRMGVAEGIGQELRRRGGLPLLKQVLSEQLGGHETIANWWAVDGH